MKQKSKKRGRLFFCDEAIRQRLREATEEISDGNTHEAENHSFPTLFLPV